MSINTPIRIFIFIFLLIFAIEAVTKSFEYFDKRKIKEVAGASTCDNQKQLNQLTSLYDAQADTKIIQVKMSGMAIYFKLLNQSPDISKEEIKANQSIIDGVPGFLSDTDKEIFDIAAQIMNVKQCYLLDPKTADNYKNFNKYDSDNLNSSNSVDTPSPTGI